jgi:hypothetical protein
VAGQPLLKNITDSDLPRCRIYKLLFVLFIAVLSISPVVDAYADYQNLSNKELDYDAGYAGSASEVDASHDGPSGKNFHINKTNTLTFRQSGLHIGREPIQSTSISDNTYCQIKGSIVPVNEKISTLTLICRPLSSDPSPPVV